MDFKVSGLSGLVVNGTVSRLTILNASEELTGVRIGICHRIGSRQQRRNHPCVSVMETVSFPRVAGEGDGTVSGVEEPTRRDVTTARVTTACVGVNGP